MRFLAHVLAIDPRNGCADTDRDRIGNEGEVPDRDEDVHRIDHGDRYAALGWPAEGRAAGPLGEARRRGEANERGNRQRPLHRTTTTPFMNGCGVQWKA